jgi:DNA-binding CsgD family transcriptional regulator
LRQKTLTNETYKNIEILLSDFPEKVSAFLTMTNKVAKNTTRVTDWGDFDDLCNFVFDLSEIKKQTDNMEWALKMVQIAYYRNEGCSYEKISRLTGVSVDKVKIVIQDCFPELAVYAHLIKAKERDKEIVRLRKQGRTIRQIAEDLEIGSPDTVYKAIQRNTPHLSSLREARTVKNKDKIIEMREAGRTYKQIARKLKVGESKISDVLKEHRPDLVGNRKYIEPELRKNIVELRFAGKSYRKIKEITGANYYRVNEIVEEELVKMAMEKVSQPQLPSEEVSDGVF